MSLGLGEVLVRVGSPEAWPPEGLSPRVFLNFKEKPQVQEPKSTHLMNLLTI